MGMEEGAKNTKKSQTIIKQPFNLYFFPRKGILTDAGDGEGGYDCCDGLTKLTSTNSLVPFMRPHIGVETR